MLKYFDGEPILGRLVYSNSERSLNVEPKPEGGIASLLVNDVQIEIDEDGQLIYVWGLCPHESWIPTTLNPPTAKPGRLRFVNGEIVPGISKRLNADKRWAVGYDASSKWLCIGDQSARGEPIAFAPGAIATLRDGELTGLWLQPGA